MQRGRTVDRAHDTPTDALGGMIAAALHDRAAAKRLPPDFKSRLLAKMRRVEGGRGPETRPCRWHAGPFPRKAAAIAALLGLGALAATVAFRMSGMLEPLQTETADAQKGETNMIMARKVAALAGAAVLTVSAPAAKLSSEPTFIFLRPETSSFWNTATNSTMTLPIDYPAGATKATLTVNGVDYRKIYPDLTASSIEIDLPAPDSPKTENVYELSLTFDNGATPRTAKLGLIQGLDTGAKGSTRCIAPASGKVWETAKQRAVLPIPYGTETFSVKLNDGEWLEVDPGLNGAQGWYALSPITKGDSISLSYLADGVSYFASFLGGGDGFFVIVK